MSTSYLEGAEHPPEKPAATVERLAKLSPLEYEQVREVEAKKLKCRTSILDKEVCKARGEMNGESSLVAEESPWDEPVDGNALLIELRNTLIRHTILPDGVATALSLWVLGTYGIDAFHIWPKVSVTSPVKRCGKTTLLETLDGLCCKALTASNITPAALFRVIEVCHPTLLIDEADTFIKGNESLRGVINSGHTKSGAFVLRTVGEDYQPKRFSTWTPMVIALIKHPPETILDRSVVVRLRRKLVTEKVHRRGPNFVEECEELRQKCRRWVEDNFDALHVAEPSLPACNNDRALDNWSPLLAIAETAGGKWPEYARRAFQQLESGDDENTIGSMLLVDIRNLFNERAWERVHSVDLVKALVELAERPWAVWRRGQPLTPNSLARQLKHYDIKSEQLRIDGVNHHGYRLKKFSDAFNRYLPLDPQISNATTLQAYDDGGFGHSQNATEDSECSV